MTGGDLEALQEEVGGWGFRTFPGSTSETILNHLCEEVLEFVGPARMEAALERWREEGRSYDFPQAEEGADVFLLLLHWFYRTSHSLLIRARVKFERNKQRRWTDTRHGYVKAEK